VIATFERLFDALRRLNPADGISLTTASTLGRLERSGAHRLSDLAVAERVTQPAMTQLVSRLERDGLATRGGDPADGRVVVVTITDEGRRVIGARREARERRVAELLPRLPAEDAAAITAALPAIAHLADLIIDERP
jgi:DNA-binding MarR family transcriptional regulator